jgi:hypothetical protein
MQTNASIDYLRDWSGRAVRGFSTKSRHLPVVRVEMLDGCLKGMSSDLNGRGFRLGGGETGDVILLDPALKDIEVEIVSRQSVLGALVNVRAKGQGVRVAGAAVDAAGIWERLPCTVDMCGYRMSLSRVPSHAPRNGFLRIGAVLLAAAGLLVFAPHAPTLQIAQPERAPAPVVNAGADLDLLQQEIRQAGLESYLSVSPDVGDTLKVSGALPAAQMAVWDDLHMAWDARQGADVVIGNVTELAKLDHLPPIAAVRFGEAPYILMADERRLVPGDIVSDGWSIAEIAETGLVLVRNAERIEVGFR